MEEIKQEITLEKIDLVRQRMNVSYKTAREALEVSGGDLVGALVNLEEQNKAERLELLEKATSTSEDWKEEIVTRGGSLVEKVKALVAEGNATKIRIKHEGRVILEIPVLFGAAGVILLPQLAAIGAVAALFSQVTIEVHRIGKPGQTVFHGKGEKNVKTETDECCCEEIDEICCDEIEEPCCDEELPK